MHTCESAIGWLLATLFCTYSLAQSDPSPTACRSRRTVDKFDRIFQLHTILSSRRTAIPLEDLMARLECSKSTLHRAINSLKDNLNAPVVFDVEAGGYKYDRTASGALRSFSIDRILHPQQDSASLADGRYELRIPYNESRELVMDIMRHGPNVKVVSPPELRDQLLLQLRESLRRYE
jgi:predicted DNA-binding transcriptional regulator YafY